uniref:hypothetical protein n=1 Tax=Agrobacterium tumefaciens TaxID=358 RepID=UPI00155DA229|nr:hypothetical protein [Agrobacterium tumefaciens]
MRMAVAAKAIETKASFGHTRFIEVCVGVACPNRIDHDMPRDQSLNSPPARRWHNRFRHHAHTTSRLRTCRSLRRHRRWVRLHYRPFDSRAIFDWMVSPPNRQGPRLCCNPPCPQRPTPQRLVGMERVPRFRN